MKQCAIGDLALAARCCGRVRGTSHLVFRRVRHSDAPPLLDQLQLVAAMGMGGVRTGRVVASQHVITAHLFWREDGSLRQMRSEVDGAQLPVHGRYVSNELL